MSWGWLSTFIMPVYSNSFWQQKEETKMKEWRGCWRRLCNETGQIMPYRAAIPLPDPGLFTVRLPTSDRNGTWPTAGTGCPATGASTAAMASGNGVKPEQEPLDTRPKTPKSVDFCFVQTSLNPTLVFELLWAKLRGSDKRHQKTKRSQPMLLHRNFFNPVYKNQSIYLSIYLSICLFIDLSSIYQSICLFINQEIVNQYMKQ